MSYPTSRSCNWWSPWADKTRVCTGAAAGTAIAVLGLATADELVETILVDTGVDTVDLSGEAYIYAAGYIKCPTTDTSGKLVRVHFVKAGAPG